MKNDFTEESGIISNHDTEPEINTQEEDDLARKIPKRRQPKTELTQDEIETSILRKGIYDKAISLKCGICTIVLIPPIELNSTYGISFREIQSKSPQILCVESIVKRNNSILMNKFNKINLSCQRINIVPFKETEECIIKVPNTSECLSMIIRLKLTSHIIERDGKSISVSLPKESSFFRFGVKNRDSEFRVDQWVWEIILKSNT